MVSSFVTRLFVQQMSIRIAIRYVEQNVVKHALYKSSGHDYLLNDWHFRDFIFVWRQSVGDHKLEIFENDEGMEIAEWAKYFFLS